jgi:hypothetical protein
MVTSYNKIELTSFCRYATTKSIHHPPPPPIIFLEDETCHGSMHKPVLWCKREVPN